MFDKFAHGNNFTSQQMQPAPFMTITPGDLKLEFVYINWKTGPPSQPSGDRALIGPWAWALTSLHKKSNPIWEMGLWHLPFWDETMSSIPGQAISFFEYGYSLWTFCTLLLCFFFMSCSCTICIHVQCVCGHFEPAPSLTRKYYRTFVPAEYLPISYS